MGDHENIIFYEISKGSDGYAYISDFDRKPVKSTQEAIDFLDECIKMDRLPADANLKKRPYPPDGNLRWSTVAEQGKNLYVLRIDKNMNASFGTYDDKHQPLPESEPVICFSPHLPAGLKPIDNAETDPCNIRWATFTVDTDKIAAGIEHLEDHLAHEHQCEHEVALPLYLNLTDNESKQPAFLAANHHHNVAAKEPRAKGNAGLLSHRGPHFTSFVSMMYVDCPDQKTKSADQMSFHRP